MLEWIKRNILRENHYSTPTVIACSLGLAVGLGFLDYVTGREIAVSPLYLVPVCWVSWMAGRKAGLAVAVISTGTWLVGDMMEHYAYPNRAIPYWNALMLMAFFVVAVVLLTALHDTHLHLEDIVEQRTAALREEMAERKRAEAARIQAERLAVVGTMAAEVAHEVRNPLSSIALNLDLVENEIQTLSKTGQNPSGEGRFLVGEMRAEVHRIQHVLEDYLQFARWPKPRCQPVALNEMLRQKLAFMNGALGRAGVQLQTHFDPSLPRISVDAEQLWQATLNLIRNSLEAMPDGGRMVLSTGRETGEICIRVADTGRGMTSEQHRQLFVPFYTTKPHGTGLGLALVQQILSEHGGRVECESAPGQGSTFTLYLPLPHPISHG